MLTAFEGVCSRGQQALSEVTTAEHLTLTEGHVPEVGTGRTALVAPEGLKLPIVDKTPLLHRPFCSSTSVLLQVRGDWQRVQMSPL